LRALIGPANFAGPSLDSLSEPFGLEPLLGKSLAVIADARFTGKNAATVTERLLSISGEDALDVARKHKVAWTGRLPCRFHIISNQLPRLTDASQAIVGRLIDLAVSGLPIGSDFRPGSRLWPISQFLLARLKD
jgi:putative DNA primase/helicase